MKSTQILNGFQIKGVNERYLESSFFDIFVFEIQIFQIPPVFEIGYYLQVYI